MLEAAIVALIDDDEVTAKKGIYEYLLTGNPKSGYRVPTEGTTTLRVRASR